MNKKDSLAFLDECLNELNNATKKEIANYKTVYEQNCSNYLNSDSFEFCAPLYDVGKGLNILAPMISYKDVIERDYANKDDKTALNYLLKKNEQISDDEDCLSFAA